MVSASLMAPGVKSDLLVIERVNSIISVIGCIFILITFCFCKAFDRPINRLIAFASAGNMMTNIATLMAAAPIENEDAFLCQTQAFLIETFMPADVLWTFCMAINVYLTFYHKFDAHRLRQMEKWYFLACYGIPFIPAFVMLFVQETGKGRIYGDSMLWCWITSEYDYLRIGIFYGPIWVVIVTTGGIYLRAGREIWKKRADLTRMINAGVKNYGTHQLNPYNLDTGMIYELADAEDEHGRHRPVVNVNTLGRTLSAADKRSRGVQPPRGPPIQDFNTDVRVIREVTTTIEEPLPSAPKPTYEYHIGTMPMFPSRPKPKKKEHRNKNDKKTRNGVPFIGDQMANLTSKEEQMEQDAMARRMAQDPNKALVAYQANRAAWGYTKVSAMFFAAMLITWVPSSANRIWSAANGGDISIPLTYVSAFVLPLQGMWNTIIYCITSSQALHDLLENMGLVFRRRRLEVRQWTKKQEDEVEMMASRMSGVLGDSESQAGRSSPDTKRRGGRPHSKYTSSTGGSADGSSYMEIRKPKPIYDPTNADELDFDFPAPRTRSGDRGERRGANGGRSIGSILQQERVARSTSIDRGEMRDRYERRPRNGVRGQAKTRSQSGDSS